MNTSFLKALLLLAVALVCFHIAAINILAYSWTPIFLVAYLFFPLITFLIHKVLEKKIDSRPQTFVTYFMGSMTVKLLASLGLLLVILYTRPLIKVHFAILFMTFYLAYTALSVTVLFKKLRQEN
ncbi:MAG: hypothetical protein RIC95_00625 [Vicingaceae bacterium]